MNNGAFGENFPYSNFHNLNMDWIIKIAKDFLDQYTHIQETIDTGLSDLDEKAQTLETALQQWYDTHSEELQIKLQNALNEFAYSANRKAQETLESIPSDYTELYNTTTKLVDSTNKYLYITRNINTAGYDRLHISNEGVITPTGADTEIGMTSLIPIESRATYTIKMFNGTTSGTMACVVCLYTSTQELISKTSYLYNEYKTITTPDNAQYIGVYFSSSSAIAITKDFSIQIVRGEVIGEQINSEYPLDYNANVKIEGIEKYIKGNVITGWLENSTYFISANATRLFYPLYNEGYRSVVLPVSEGDIFYYSGSDEYNGSPTAARSYAFYDTNGNIISFAEHGRYRNFEITVPANARYMVLNQSREYGFIDCYINTLPSEVSENVDYSIINRIFNIEPEYAEQDLVYNSAYSPWYYRTSSISNKGLSCSDWGMLAFFGISAKDSEWNDIHNIPGFGFEHFRDLYDLKSNYYAWASVICKYADDKGYTFIPNSDMSNCKPGDIIFYNLNPNDDNDPMFYPPVPVGTDDTSGFPTIPEYKGIDHCAVFVGRVSADYYMVMEVTGPDIGYVTTRFIANTARTAIAGLRPKCSSVTKSISIKKINKTRIVRANEEYVTLDECVTENEWYTLLVKGITLDTSFLRMQVKYLGDSNYTNILSESVFGYGVNRLDNTARFIVKPERPFKEIRIQSVGTPTTSELGFYISDIELYNGYA